MGTPSTSAVTFRAHIVPSAVLQHAAGNDNPLKCSLSRAECVFGEHRDTNKKDICGCRCLLHPLQSDTLAFLDENNMPGIGKWLRKKRLGIDMGVKAASGFCTYPLYMLF